MDLASGTCLPRAPSLRCVSARAACARRAARSSSRSSARRRRVPFPSTTRWLRGRLVAAATGAPDGGWVPLPERLGVHDRDAIRVAARGLEREGFLDLRDGEVRVRQ